MEHGNVLFNNLITYINDKRVQTYNNFIVERMCYESIVNSEFMNLEIKQEMYNKVQNLVQEYNMLFYIQKFLTIYIVFFLPNQ